MPRSLLQLLYDYRLLLALQDAGVPLDDEEAHRFRSAQLLLRGEGLRRAADRRAFPRLPYPRPAHLTCSGQFLLCRLADVSGGGVRLRCLDPRPVGEELLVHLADTATALEYTFPACVVWAKDTEMGLRFEGVPTLASPRDADGPGGSPRPRRRTPFAA